VPEYPEICPTPARGRVKTGIEQQEAPRIGIRRKAKKRPRLFSPGRLGSPPPELPNYDLDSRVPSYTCKRHFGNGIGAALEVEPLRLDYCFFQDCPLSTVVQTSPVEVEILPFCASANSKLKMSPLSVADCEAGMTRAQ